MGSNPGNLLKSFLLYGEYKINPNFKTILPSKLDWFLSTEKMRELLLDMLFMKYFTISYEFLFFLDRAFQHFLTINTKICMPNIKIHNLFYYHAKTYFRYLWLMIWNEMNYMNSDISFSSSNSYLSPCLRILRHGQLSLSKVGVKDTCNKKIVNEKHPLLQYRYQWILILERFAT